MEHRIWVPPEASKVASTKACLISGLRGTGKTALLNCLDVVGANRNNVRFLNPEDRPKNCIGVYISILSEFTEFLAIRTQETSKNLSEDGLVLSWLHAHWFRAYLLFTCLSRTLEIIDDCQRINVLSYNARQEGVFVDGFQELWGRHFSSRDQRHSIRSILDCASVISKICMETRINSVRLYPERVAILLEQLEPIRFYRDFCRLISETNLLASPQVSHHIKISLDDVHRFGRNEQAILNGIIEVNAAPVTWNLSYVTGGYDPSLSPDPSAPLTHHDIEHVDLNYVANPRGFRQLCQKLYNMRVGNEDMTQDPDSLDWGYGKVLSNPNVSILFNQLVQDTASVEFRNRLYNNLAYVTDVMEKKLGGPRLGRRQDRQSDKRRYLYHTYIFNVIFQGVREDFEKFINTRSEIKIDNYFRQKNVAALVCAANELGRQVPYAGKNVLIALSDGCIRDFLRILAILYDNASAIRQGHPRNTPDFFSPDEERPIPLDEQSKAFVEASRSYLEQAEYATDRVGRVLANILSAIGELTRLLQSKDRHRALQLPERGRIRLNFAEATLLGDTTHRIGLLREALSTGQNTGSIRILEGVARSRAGEPETNQVTFRLHRLIAPHYNYGSRGPQRAIYIPLINFIELAEEIPTPPRDWAERVFKIARDQAESEGLTSSQQDLF